MSSKKPIAFSLALFAILGSISLCHAQEKKNPFADNIIGTLSNPKMARELELLDEQKESIRELLKEFGQLHGKTREDFKDRWEAAGDPEREVLKKEYYAQIEEGRLEIVKEMKGNLLPHQIDRLEQLSAQRMMTEGKGRESAGLLSDQMVDYLDISTAQKKRIEDKTEDLKKEVGEKIRKLLEEAKQELLAELSAGQKAKYEKLLGEPIADEKDEDKDRKRGRKSNRG